MKKYIIIILLVSLAAFSCASNHAVQNFKGVPFDDEIVKAEDTVVLNGNETIKVGYSVYSLKELIEAKKKNEVLEEMLQKRVSRSGLDDSAYSRCSKLFYVYYDGVIIKSIEVKH